MIIEATETLLPGGLWAADGRLHRRAWLRPLTGREEEALAGAAEPAAAVTDVLGRCLLRLGDLAPLPPDVARHLLVGDRDTLLRTLRQITFGDEVIADLLCPWPECGEPVTITMRLSELPVHEPPVRAATHAVDLPGGAVEFRLPDGGDQEALSGLARRDPAAALTALLSRCVLTVGGVASDPERVAALGPADRAQLEAAMERLAPRLETVVATACAECGRAVCASFDLRRCFFGDLAADRALLYREVHHLAFHYHWSEAEIMAMTREKRRTYLDVLSDEIERCNDGA